MIHEFKEIIKQAVINQQKGLKNVLATVVFLEGSSYRKPGVRMLISEDLSSVGAVSGGCVEKEIIHRATTVFRDNKPKVITYDGRYKLGCEGILYVLIEPFFVTAQLISAFSKANSKRESLQLTSYFKKENEVFGEFGTSVTFENRQQFAFTETVITKSDVAVYNQVLQPAFKLIIIGGEHDAVKLCKIAATCSWPAGWTTAWGRAPSQRSGMSSTRTSAILSRPRRTSTTALRSRWTTWWTTMVTCSLA